MRTMLLLRMMRTMLLQDHSRHSGSGGTTLLNWVQLLHGYHPNAVKTWLIVKEHHLDEAKDKFKDSGISITTEGKRHLGAAIGTSQFYVERIVC